MYENIVKNIPLEILFFIFIFPLILPLVRKHTHDISTNDEENIHRE